MSVLKTLSELVAIRTELDQIKLQELFSEAEESDDEAKEFDAESDESDEADKEPGEKVLWTVSVKRSDGKVEEKRVRASSLEAIKKYFGDDFVDALEDEKELEEGATGGWCVVSGNKVLAGPFVTKMRAETEAGSKSMMQAHKPMVKFGTTSDGVFQKA